MTRFLRDVLARVRLRVQLARNARVRRRLRADVIYPVRWQKPARPYDWKPPAAERVRREVPR